MNNKNQKLELTWIGKENWPRLEPRVLLEDPKKSYHAAQRVTENDLFDNRLIFGDNLLALKALEQEFTGKIKCIFIDPPYNTGSAFEHYDDGIEHSLWLSLMRDRLVLIQKLLSDDGSFWVTIDDNEAHYLKVLCDEIFGRSNFLSTVIWQKKYTQANDAVNFSDNHDFILVFAKDKTKFILNSLPREEKQNQAYKNPDNDKRGNWKATPLHAKSGGSNSTKFIYKFNNGVVWTPPTGTFPRFREESLRRMDNNNEIWFGANGKSIPSRKTFLSDVKQGVSPKSIWLYDEVGHNHEARTEAKLLLPDDPFGTPKPERLMQRIITLATNPNDLVLDSFAGSGTTGAVAHKMGRRWIMVELGEHCQTHIIPRMKKVIDGIESGGITDAVGWKGGGGFRYFHMAPSLLEKDRWDHWVISKNFNAAMLAEALCKLEGFSYNPSDTIYWQQGHSTERDFIYVTTQNLSRDQLQQLSDDVGQERSLLVLCSAFRSKSDGFTNLTIKKIPKQVLASCEWGHDDYSLNVENLPKAPTKPKQKSLFDIAGGDK
jgi:adenine-specific DNA-methyltransferase